MNCSFQPIGNLVREVDIRNSNNQKMKILGISSFKYFFETRAKFDRSKLTNYKIIEPGQFGLDLMNVTRTERASIALKMDQQALLSQAYYVFKVIDDNTILPGYLMMQFERSEFERLLLFKTDGDIRGTISWEQFCEIEIPLPSIEKQQEYVKIYSNLIKIIDDHEKSFSDLQLIANTFIENLVIQYGTEELGTYIVPTDTRNSDNTFGTNDLRGISTTKKFISSKANTTGVSFNNYKVVKPGQFAYVPDTSRRGEKIGLAYNDNDTYIISSIYTTFEISNTNNLLPEFLLIWFKRPEFDRYARYNSWGSARETFDWNEMTRVRLPIPPIPVQKSIVDIYHILETRKKMANKLKNIIKEISPILIKDAKDKCMEVNV